MSNIRDIVRRHVIAETEDELKNTGIDKDILPRMLDFLSKDGHIDKKVESILNAFKSEIELNSPEKKRKKVKRGVFSAINLIITTLIAYGVNETQWVFVWSLAAVAIILNSYFIFSDS